jgi:hypothetical protein
MLSSKSREHRLRVLENQARIATERGAPGQDRPDSSDEDAADCGSEGQYGRQAAEASFNPKASGRSA